MKTDVLESLSARSQSPSQTLPSHPHWDAIALELQWLKQVIDRRMAAYFEEKHLAFDCLPAPALDPQSHYGQFVRQYRLSLQQRLIIILALAMEIEPQCLDILQTKNKLYDLPYAEFGGILNPNRPGFQPTLQTALFLLAGADQQATLNALGLFEPDKTLFAQDILKSDTSADCTAQLPLQLSRDSRQRLLYGHESLPQYSADFPAALLHSAYNWEDLVLPPGTEVHLQELELWLKHHERSKGQVST